jgi:nucleoid-associated protein YgaU
LPLPRRTLVPAILALAVSTAVLSACVDDSPGAATAVPLQPTVERPALATAAPASPIPAAASPSPSPDAAGRTYIVKQGDTLSTIASAVYGDASQWRVIFDANRDQLPSESQLQIGQTLRIPPLPPTPIPSSTPLRPA